MTGQGFVYLTLGLFAILFAFILIASRDRR